MSSNSLTPTNQKQFIFKSFIYFLKRVNKHFIKNIYIYVILFNK